MSDHLSDRMSDRMSDRPAAKNFTARALVPQRWDDFVQLFGQRGACGGCWCMYPRLTRKEFEAGKGEGNRRAMREFVDTGRVPGVLGYLGDEVVGWCSIEPRELIGTLARSRILKPVDEVPVWSVVCLFVAKEWRRQGVSVQMIEAAVQHAVGQGASCVEAYPVEPRKPDMPPAFAWYGLAAAYLKAGFSEVARRSPTRPIMRYRIDAESD